MRYLSILLLGVWISLGTGCAKKQTPPVDSNGNTPQQALLEIYTLLINEEYEAAKEGFDTDFIETFLEKQDKDFNEYYKKVVDGWPVEGLTTTINGNKYNKDMWSVSIKPDMKDADSNDPRTFGRAEDLLIIDGEWKIVYGNHHLPKS